MDARTNYRHRYRIALGLALGSLLFIRSSFALPLSETIQIQTFSTHSRIVFHVDEGVPADLKETSDGFQVLFKGLSFADFGAPLGEEDAWAAELKRSLKDPRLASVGVKEVKGGLMVEGKWKFATGPAAPAEPKMETFDYREHGENDAQFVVDFWVKKGPTVAESVVTKKKQVHAKKVQKVRDDLKQRLARRKALEKAKRELDDLTRSCKSPLSDEKDVFLSFMSVNERVEYLRYLPQGSPDSGFPYFEPKGDESKAAQFVRLALKLYREDKHALVIRTLDFMDAEQPGSAYRDEMRFLRANALLRLGMAAEAEKILDGLKNEAKGKPVALYSALYLAGKQVRRKDSLATYETFSWLFTHYPDHRLAWLFHLGAAESLAAIKQTEQAVKEYEWVVKNAKLPSQKAQGAFRVGNVYLDRRQYEQALAAYSTGLRSFKKESDGFPAIHLNRGETLYSLGQYEQARKVFEEIASEYLNYPEGWRATFRLGEIYGRREGAQNEKISRRWFYETINRYPFSAGSTLARLRLLPCGDHGGFTLQAARRFFKGEAKTFDGTGQISMVHYGDLRALSQVRAYVGLKGGETIAAEVAEAELVQVKAPQAKAEIGRLYEGLFRRNIVALLDQGKSFEALKYFDEHSKYRVRDASSADPDYLLRLSLAASDLGLGKLAAGFAEDYRKISSSARGLATQSGAKSRDLDSKLRQSEQVFAEARALWISGDHGKDTEAGLKTAEQIRKKLDQVAAESPFSFEKELILGLLEEQHGQLKTARAHALKAQLLVPSTIDPQVNLRIQSWLAELEAKAGNPKTAYGMYLDLEKHARAAAKQPEDAKAGKTAQFLGIPPVPSLGEILLSQGQLLDGQKRWGESASIYSKAVEEGLGGNQAMYGYARALLKSGEKANRGKAISTLEKLTESKTEDFWKRLAQDTLEGERLRESHR